MKKTILLVLLLAVLAVSLVSAQQTVFGTIFDINGVTPVPGASVNVTINHTVSYMTTSMADGSYSVDVSYVVGEHIDVEAIKATRGTASALALDVGTQIDVILKPACSDGYDNDGDGKKDSADWGCYTEEGVYVASDNNEANPQCSDGINNDADPYIDSADPGCHKYYSGGTHEYKPYLNDENKHPECFDGIDNDEDCFTDYPLDSGCDSIFDNKELNEPHYGDGSAWVNIAICSEDFVPMIWMCGRDCGTQALTESNDDKISPECWGRVTDDNVETGRISTGGQPLVERINNYAFEGEQIQWKVLVLDKNGFEKIRDVYVTVDGSMEANCKLDHVVEEGEHIKDCYNAMIDEEVFELATASNMFAEYTCTFTVETPNSMYGEAWVTVEVEDLDGAIGEMDEKEYWYFNPEIALTVDGTLEFGTVRPGTVSYSPTLLVGNAADYGSGVLLDMFISGTDFYDPANSGAKCPTTNQLSLTKLRYYAVNGAYSTQNDLQIGRNRDNEGYLNIEYGDHFERAFYNDAEMIQSSTMLGPYYAGNILSPGSEMAMTFKLALPEPCNGDFTDGDVFFWGEAI